MTTEWIVLSKLNIIDQKLTMMDTRMLDVSNRLAALANDHKLIYESIRTLMAQTAVPAKEARAPLRAPVPSRDVPWPSPEPLDICNTEQSMQQPLLWPQISELRSNTQPRTQ